MTDATASSNNAKQPATAVKPSAKAARTAMEKQRDELNGVPPPTKARYGSVKNAASWQNPFVVVGTHTLKITVLMQDANEPAR